MGECHIVSCNITWGGVKGAGKGMENWHTLSCNTSLGFGGGVQMTRWQVPHMHTVRRGVAKYPECKFSVKAGCAEFRESMGWGPAGAAWYAGT